MASTSTAAAAAPAGAQKAPLLTEELRQKTKGLHGKMDRLVQLGLFTILDYQIYRQLLLGFYFVFKTYEEECEKHLKSSKVHPWVLHTYMPELWRTQAFEADLSYFYGSDWKQCVIPSKPAQAYMEHIRDIAKRQPEKLVAYPATLYLGIFFGGQIARSKIIKSTNFFPSPPERTLGGDRDSGIAIFAFREKSGNNATGSETSAQNQKLDPNKVKDTLKARLNSIPGIDDQSETAVAARKAIGEEAQEIFIRNMELMKTVEGVSIIWTRWIMTFLLYLLIAAAFYQILLYRTSDEQAPQ